MRTLQLSAPVPGKRRLAGAILGGMVGLAFAAVHQLINRALLPGLPLYQPPFGPVGNIMLGVLIGVLLGLMCAWPDGATAGVFFASAVSAAAIVIGSFISAAPSGTVLVAVVVTGIFIALPFWGMLVPLLAALRWGVNRIEEGVRERQPLSRSASIPLLLVLLAALFGMSGRFTETARESIVAGYTLIEAGRAASEASALPAPLAEPGAAQFFERGRVGSYTLQVENQRVSRFRIPRPGRNFDNHQFVVVRFASGWNLVCVFIEPEVQALCQGYDQLPP